MHDLPDLDDVAALSVHADALLEAGDPQGLLMRAQLSGDAALEASVLQQHGPTLVSGIDLGGSLLTWRAGFVTDLALSALPAEGLMPLPALRRLRRLALGTPAPLAGLECFTALEELVVLSDSNDLWPSLEGVRLPALRRLTLGLQTPHGLDQLAALQLPGLRALDLRATQALDVSLVRILLSAPWAKALERVTVRLRTEAGVLALRRWAPRTSKGVELWCAAHVLQLAQDLLPGTLPEASIILWPQRHAPEDHHRESTGEVTVSVVPRMATVHFRTLSPRSVTSSEPDGSWEAAGSGVPLSEVFAAQDARCGWCAGIDTPCIADSCWPMSNAFVATRVLSWELECQHCRLFTQSGAVVSEPP